MKDDHLKPTAVEPTFASLALYHHERVEMYEELRDEADNHYARVECENIRLFHEKAAKLCEEHA